MTASKTPNLNLMSPVIADSFDPDDFATSFGILDTVPGIQVIANQAARPSSLGAAQHGRMYWQADQNIMWVWVQPSSLSAGAWQRSGCKGLLGSAGNAATVSTTAINTSTAPTVVSVSVLIPGGRPVLVLYRWVFIGNAGSKFATINMFGNSSNLLETRHNGVDFGSAYTTDRPYPPQSQQHGLIYGAPSSQTTVNFQLKLRAQDPAVVGSTQGGGTSFIIGTSMDVFEL